MIIVDILKVLGEMLLFGVLGVALIAAFGYAVSVICFMGDNLINGDKVEATVSGVFFAFLFGAVIWLFVNGDKFIK